MQAMRLIPGYWQRALTILFFVLTLASCVAPNIDHWPNSVPDQQVFIAAYSADAENKQRQSLREYLQWVVSFYQGNLIHQSGWHDIQTYMITAPSLELNEELHDQMGRLGVVIGSEWAKHNDIRLIDTRMLSLWGSTIQLASNFDTQQQSIEVISEDVSQLLNGNLDKEDVLESRYADILGLELFGGF
jgi:hypothetical protein